MQQSPLGAKGTSTLRVQPEHLANRFKDAMLPQVLATPVMILIMENAALNAIGPFFGRPLKRGRHYSGCKTLRRSERSALTEDPFVDHERAAWSVYGFMAGERYACHHHRLPRLLRSITSPSAMQGNA
jgi:hypothetical protein